MKHANRGLVRFAVALMLGAATGLSAKAKADEPPAALPENWENVSESFTREIAAHDIEPAYLRSCLGLIVTPTGDIVMQTATKGICVSKDQGASWAVVENNKILGRCENGFGFSIAYPYDGRMAFFCYDGAGGTSGGLSRDGAKSWKPFAQIQRGVQQGDVDWNARDPQLIFGLTHEPFYSVLSEDGGKSWKQLSKDETGSGGEVKYCLGVIEGKTLTRYNSSKQGIELSDDAGQTWIHVADYAVTGRRPVHYGKTIYWTTSRGVITTTNGKDWTLTGPGAEGARYGPYFGSKEQEFVVVTDKSFLKTEDAGKTWKPLAKFYMAPDIFHHAVGYSYFGWDPKQNILYVSGLGASVYRLKL